MTDTAFTCITDMFGRPLKTDDVVTYPVRTGSWMEMRFGVVTFVGQDVDTRKPYLEVMTAANGRLDRLRIVTVVRLDRVVKVSMGEMISYADDDIADRWQQIEYISEEVTEKFPAQRTGV